MKHWKLDIYKTVLFWDIKWVVQRLVLHGCSKRSYVVFSETFLRFYQVSLRLNDFLGVLVVFFFYKVLLFSEMCSVCFLRGCIGVVLLRLCFPIDCIGVFWYIVLFLFLKIVLPFSDKLYCCFLRDCSGVFEQFRY